MTRSTHQLYLAVSAAVVSSFGSAMLSFALSLYLLAKTGSSLSFALSVIIQPLISLVLMPIVGPIVDRYAKKIVIAISQCASMVALAGFGWYLQTTASHLLLAAVCLLVVLRASDLFTNTAQSAAQVALVSPDDLQALTSYTQAANAFSGLFSSVAGAGLYAVMPFTWFVWLECGCEALGLGLTLMLNFNLFAGVGEVEPANWWEQLKAGFAFLRGQSKIIALITMAVLLNLFDTVLSVSLPLMWLQTMHLPAWQYALGDSAMAIGLLGVGVWFGQRKPLTKPLHFVWVNCALSGLLLASIGAIVMLKAWPIVATVVLIGLQLAMGINQNLINIPIGVWMRQQMPAGMQGRVFSLMNAVVMAAMPIGVGGFTLLLAHPLAPIALWQAGMFVIAGGLASLSCWLIGRRVHF